MTPEQKKAIEEQQAFETPLEDLKNDALKHYEEAANSIHHWSSFVVDAIKAYNPKRDEEVERLKSVMIAAAEEIKEHWQAHCDEEGYGPTNLLHRLEKGIPSQYGYTAGAFLNQEQTIKGQIEVINNLKKENEELKSRYEAMSKYSVGITNESHKTDIELTTLKHDNQKLRLIIDTKDSELDALKKQVELWKEYHGFLKVANEGPQSIAYVHGWRFSEEVIKKGTEYRYKLGI